MSDRLSSQAITPNDTTGTRLLDHSTTVEEDGRRFEELLAEHGLHGDARDNSGARDDQSENPSLLDVAHPNGGYRSAAINSTFNGIPENSGTAEWEQAVSELQQNIREAYQQGRYADAKQTIDQFLQAHDIAATPPSGTSQSVDESEPYQVMSRIFQMAEEMYAAVSGDEIGRAQNIAWAAGRSLYALKTNFPDFLLFDMADELMGHFKDVATTLPFGGTFWEPLGVGDNDRFAATAQQAALSFADINPRLQILFSEKAMIAEAGPRGERFDAVTEAAVGEVVQHLDAWHQGTQQRATSRAAIEAIIDQLGSGSGRSPAEINSFVSELARRDKLEALFEFYGEDRAALIDQLAAKGAQAVPDDPWYEQVMIAVWDDYWSSHPGRIEQGLLLLLHNKNQSMSRDLAKNVFLAAGGPDGVLSTVAATEVVAARQAIIDTAKSAYETFNTARINAKANGSEDALLIAWNTHGVLKAALAFTDSPSITTITSSSVEPVAAAPLPPALSIEGLSEEAALAVVDEMKAAIEDVKSASGAFSAAVARAKDATDTTSSESSVWATTPDRSLMNSAWALEKAVNALAPYREIIGNQNAEAWQQLQNLGASSGQVANAQVAAFHRQIAEQRLTGDATTQQDLVRSTQQEYREAIEQAKLIGTADDVDSLSKRQTVVRVYEAARAYQNALEGLRPLVGDAQDALSVDAQISNVNQFADDWNVKYQAELLQQGLAIQNADRLGDGFRVKEQALALLQPLAERPAAFADLIQQAYGTAVDPAKIESLRQKVLAGDMSWMPTIQFVDKEILNGAMGAYDGQVIYLQSELLNDSSNAAATYLEESGHALDNYFSAGIDTEGDEGELFRRLVSGEALSAEQVAAIRSENDHGVITFDGREIDVEFSFWTDIRDIVTAPARAVIDVAEIVVDVVVDAVEDIGEAVLDLGEEILDLGEDVLDFHIDVLEGVVDLGEEIIDFHIDVLEEVVEFGEDIIDFHVDLIEDAVDLYVDALEGAWDFVEEEVLQSEWFPVVLMVAGFVPGLNVIAAIGRGVYGAYNAYQGIENENWAQFAMGLVSASGAFQDMGFSNDFVTALGDIGEAVQTGLGVQELVENGDINALISLASQHLPADSVTQQWVDRLETGTAAYDAAERGDLLGAVGLGAGLLGDFSADGTDFDTTLSQISDTALNGQALQDLIEDGDYGLAAQLINNNYAEFLSLDTETGDKLVSLGEVLTHLDDAKGLIEDHDYLAAAQILANSASQFVGDEGTKVRLESTANALGHAGSGLAAIESGNYETALGELNQALGMPLDAYTQAFLMQTGEKVAQAQQIHEVMQSGNYFEAASMAATLGASFSSNPDLQEHFNASAEVLMRAEGINDAITDGNYLEAAALASELGASVTDDATLKEHLQNTAGVLEQGQKIDEAYRQGNFLEAAELAAQLAGTVSDNPTLRTHFANSADLLDQAGEINLAIATGDYASAAALAANLGASTIDSPALTNFFEQTSGVLERAQGIHEAVDSGDYRKAADLALELADSATDNPALQEHFDTVATALDKADQLATTGNLDSPVLFADELSPWIDPKDFVPDNADNGERLTAAVDEIVELLDAWTFNPAERRILEILKNVPDSDINELIVELDRRGYAEKLFTDIDGGEYHGLLDILAEKNAQQVTDDPWYEQALDGVLGGVAAFGDNIVQGIKALFKLETYQGLYELGKTLYLADGGPGGLLHIFAPDVVAKARQDVRDMVTSIKDNFVTDWNNAVEQGREVELAVRWTTQGVADIASSFLVAGSVKKLTDAARIANKILGSFDNVSDIADTLRDASQVENVVRRTMPENADTILDALRQVRNGDTPDAELIAKLDVDELDEVAAALRLTARRNEAVDQIMDEARVKGVEIRSDAEAQEYLDFRARQEGIDPPDIHAVTLGDDLIMVRPEHMDNPRILREELIHTDQVRSGNNSSDSIVANEIEARKEIIARAEEWAITPSEVAEMLREIEIMETTGKY